MPVELLYEMAIYCNISYCMNILRSDADTIGAYSRQVIRREVKARVKHIIKQILAIREIMRNYSLHNGHPYEHLIPHVRPLVLEIDRYWSTHLQPKFCFYCLKFLSNPYVYANCRHTFHPRCILFYYWIGHENQPAACPMCRVKAGYDHGLISIMLTVQADFPQFH